MTKINIIQFRNYHYLKKRRDLLKQARKRYSKNLILKSKRRISNDNNVIHLDLEIDGLKI